MLTKKECDKDVEEIEAIYYSGDTSFSAMKLFKTSIENIYKLIKKYFELKEKYSKILDDVHDYRYEVYAMKMTIRNLCKYFGVESEKELQNIFLNKPYKFEELHEGMWVWDKKYGMWNHILEIRTNCAGEQEIEFDCSLEKDEEIYNDIFEENRFYRKQVDS
ncbi:MAG: hypothetical protein HFF36_02435 [Coprobacillus sp.]|nr:hypothetical protein [Coprobacillus sp.]